VYIRVPNPRNPSTENTDHAACPRGNWGWSTGQLGLVRGGRERRQRGGLTAFSQSVIQAIGVPI
jgi:hypothetical protein